MIFEAHAPIPPETSPDLGQEDPEDRVRGYARLDLGVRDDIGWPPRWLQRCLDDIDIGP
jgi:hypothetical protein